MDYTTALPTAAATLEGRVSSLEQIFPEKGDKGVAFYG
jgi:hypothetical protein